MKGVNRMSESNDIYDRIGQVLRSFQDDGYGWVSRDELAGRFKEMFPNVFDKLTHGERPYIPGMLSHYMGDNEPPKRPEWAPKVRREKSGETDGYVILD